MFKHDVGELLTQYRRKLGDVSPSENGNSRQQMSWLAGEVERAMIAGRMPEAYRLLGYLQGNLVGHKLYKKSDVDAQSRAMDMGLIEKPPGLRVVPARLQTYVCSSATGEPYFSLELRHWVPEAVIGCEGVSLSLPIANRDELANKMFSTHLTISFIDFDYDDFLYFVGLSSIDANPLGHSAGDLFYLINAFEKKGWKLLAEKEWADKWESHLAEVADNPAKYFPDDDDEELPYGEDEG